MLEIGAFALAMACLSMFLIFVDKQQAGNLVFGLSLVAMITSTLVSFYETVLSNQSLNIEINDVYQKEANKSKETK